MKFLTAASLLIAVTTILLSCKKDNGSGSNGNSRKIKYELTGNYSGKFDVVYTDNVNGMTHVTDVTLPWSKEIQYDSKVITIGIGAQGATVGSPGQTATIKIYSNGVVVKTSSGKAAATGGLVVPTVSYGF